METRESIWCLFLCWKLISAIAHCGLLSCFKLPVVALLQRTFSFPFSLVSLVSDACLLFDDFLLPGSGIFITLYFSSSPFVSSFGFET